MKRDIKSKILETARTMFGEDGYNNVSMRNIADALGISVGNLTYHFKKKEDLIEEVFIEKHSHYRKGDPPENLTELHDLFERSIRHQRENAYYFRHYTQIAQVCPKVYEIQQEVKTDRRENLEKTFQILQRDGYIRPEGFQGQYSGLAQVLTMTNVYWSTGYNDAISPIKSHWSIVYPILTQKGIAVFKREIENQIND